MSPSIPRRPWSSGRSTARSVRRRTALLWSVAVGALVPIYFLGVADTSYLAWDFRAYYAAADAAVAGEQFVGADPGLPGVRYVYPPVAVTMFLPHALVGDWRVAFLVQTAVNLAAALALAALVVRVVETRRGPLPAVDRALIAAFCVASAPMVAVLGQGQVDALVALALAAVFVAVERGRHRVAGGLVAAVALVKVFPVVLGLWLAWRRAWRALATAAVTGIVGLALGAACFGPHSYVQYLAVLAERSRLAAFGGTVSPNFFAMSLYRPLSQLLPAVDPYLYAPLSVALVAPSGWLVARRGRTLADRLATYLVAVVAMLLVSPASNALYVVYAYFPVLCLLYLSVGRSRSLLVVGVVAMVSPVQPAQVAALLATLGVPATLSAPTLAALQAVLTVASVPLLGLLAVVCWCTLRAASRGESPARDSWGTVTD